MARVAVVDDRQLAEADPGEKSFHETLPLAHLLERIERAARDQAEIAGVARDRRLREPAHHAIERRRGRLLEARLAGARSARAVDDVVTFAPVPHEGRNQLGRILQVGIDDDDRIGVGMVEAGGERELLAEIARQLQRRHARIGLAQRAHDRVGIVAAAVVDVEHFAVEIEPVEHGGKTRVEIAQALALVVRGHDDGELGHGRLCMRERAC